MYVKVWVHAGAKKEVVKATSADHFEISVREEPVQNLANRRVIALIARHFGVPANKVRIVSGHHSPSKMLAVDSNES